MAEMEKQEVLLEEAVEEQQEGLRLEELEALADEFTLEDLAEFDEGLEFDASDLELLKPSYTKKEKLKMILMNNTVFSIIKWSIAGLGLIGLVFHILALISPDISEALSTSVSAAIRNGITSVSSLLTVSLMEILALVVLVGILAYAGFLIFKTIKEKEGIKIAGFWVQFGYVLVAVFGFGYLLFSLCYGVTTNRPMLYKSELEDYVPNYFTEERLDTAMLYYIDQINEVSVKGRENIFFTTAGNSKYASTGSSLEEIGEAVNHMFDLASEDYGFLKGSDVTVKELMAAPMYTAMGIGSIYCPITSEVLINPDYPEVIIPMQVARAIAKQRGITNDHDASFVAFLVCSQYADDLGKLTDKYNTNYIKYAAYMDAYLEVSSGVYSMNPNVHLYCASALKESAKKDVVALVKDLDALYGNTSNLVEFQAASKKTSTDDYKVLAKLLYAEFTRRVDNGSIGVNTDPDDPVPASKRPSYMYLRYLVSYFSYELEDNWYDTVQDVYEEYNPEPEENE